MKKIIALLTAFLLICVALCGCSERLMVEKPFDLTEMAVADEVVLDTEGKNRLSFDLILPSDGYLKMQAYDSTEYTDYFDDAMGIYVTFKDESGKTLYKNVSIKEGYLEKYHFDAGNITVEVKLDGAPKQMEQLTFCWAFAEDTDKPVELTLGSKAAAVATDQKAQFSFSVEKDALLRIACAEGCIYESDCNFYIENSEGRVTEDISICGTEWTSREVFLPEGDYLLTVCDINAVATCFVTVEEEISDVIMEQNDEIKLPAVFGFTVQNAGDRWVEYDVAENDKYLIMEATGTGTYYDNSQMIDVVIMAQDSTVIAEETFEGYERYDISDVKGKIKIEFGAIDSCIVEIKTEQ